MKKENNHKSGKLAKRKQARREEAIARQARRVELYGMLYKEHPENIACKFDFERASRTLDTL